MNNENLGFGSKFKNAMQDPTAWFALSNAFSNFAGKSNPAMSQMVQHQLQQKQQQASDNRTLEYLQSTGQFSAEQLSAARSNPMIMKAMISQAMQGPNSQATDAMKTLEQKAAALGYQPGTPQYEALMLGRDPRSTSQLSGEQMTAAGALRDDLRTDLGHFGDVQKGWETVSTFYENPGAVSDYALAVSFAKILDPGSVAREGEVSAVANSGSIPDAVKSAVLNALQGNGLLPPEVRSEIMARSQDLYIKAASSAKSTLGRYEGMGNRYGLQLGDYYSGSGITVPEAIPFTASPPLKLAPDGVDQALWDSQSDEWKLEFLRGGI